MKNKNSGFTIVEVLTGIAMMGIVTYGIVSGTKILFSTEAKTGSIGDESKIIQSIIENISSDPAVFQKNFTTSATTTNQLLDPATLPLAYGKNYFGPKAGCPVQACFGYIGYVIRPFPQAGFPQPGMDGLFEVTLRLQKLPFDPAKPSFTDYVFLTQSN